MKSDRYMAICAGLLVAIGVTISYTASQDGYQHPEQHVAERPARKRVDEQHLKCPATPCLEVPAACFVHGGAPTAPECLRD